MRIRNAECGIKKVPIYSRAVIPHSEFRIIAVLSLDCESYPNFPCQDKMESEKNIPGGGWRPRKRPTGVCFPAGRSLLTPFRHSGEGRFGNPQIAQPHRAWIPRASRGSGSTWSKRMKDRPSRSGDGVILEKDPVWAKPGSTALSAARPPRFRTVFLPPHER